MPLLGSFTSQLTNTIAKAKGVSLQFILDNFNVYGTPTNDYFGYSVAVSGNYAIVGAHLEDAPTGTPGLSSGTAYIYNVTTGVLVRSLTNPNAYGTVYNDFFGYSVAISDNYAIVGAYGEESNAGAEGAGKAYIFNWTTGTLLHTLNNPTTNGTGAGYLFGSSVAISGNYAIVGAYKEDDAGGTESGKAYIFNVSTGALVHTLNNPSAYSTTAGDQFGYSVAISGNYAIVGAQAEDDAGGTSSGKAYIYNVTTGALVHTLNNPNTYGPSAGDYFGWSVAISINYAVVGAWGESDAGGTSSGKAYIYNVTTGALLYTLNNPNAFGTSGSDNFGSSVAVSGNYAIVGASAEDDVGQFTGVGAGKAYIFNVTTGAFIHTINNPNTYSTSLAYDYFGYSVAISGDYAIVGAFGEDTSAGNQDAGKAYIYKLVLPGTQPSQQVYTGSVSGVLTYTWLCPAGVTSVSVVCVGGGGGGDAASSNNGNNNSVRGGGGGGLGWKNNIAVTPGNAYIVQVGNGGASGPGGTSFFISSATVAGLGGQNPLSGGAGGGYVGDGGGFGGAGGTGVNPGSPSVGNPIQFGGGGGAGGYSGSGGAGGNASNGAGSAGSGGGGGGGGAWTNAGYSPTYGYGSSSGGGVALNGIGPNGAGGAGATGPESGQGPTAGGGGSSGSNGVVAGGGGNPYGASGGEWGGGASSGGFGSPYNYGGVGAVRIIWSGQSGIPRSFPSNAGNV